MKKTLLFMITVFAVNFSFAQWNFNAGLTLTDYKINSNYGLNTDNYMKTAPGVFLKVGRNINLGNVVFVEPALGFNTTNTIDKENVGIKSSNFFIPIEIGLKIGNTIKLNTGLQANFVTGAKTIRNEEETNIKDLHKPNYFDFILGLGINPTQKIGVTFKYNTSIGSVLKEHSYQEDDYRKRVFSIGLKLNM